MTSLKPYKLSKVCTKIGSGATPRGGKEAYLSHSAICLIRSQNVLDFSFSTEGLAYIDNTQAKELDNVTIYPNDVLLNITGDSVARVCSVPSYIKEARVNQHVAILRADEKELHWSFLKYYLLNPEIKSHLLTLASAGATRKAITKGMLEELEIKAPDYDKQCHIAEILSALDDKIELNRQMNQTLEEMAQLLFKEMCLPKGDELPEGWKEGTLGDIMQLQRGYDLPSSIREDGSFPIISASGVNGYHNDFKCNSPGVTTGRSGLLGEVYYIQEDFWPLNTSLFVKHYKIGKPIFSYFILKSINLKNYNEGSAVPTLNRNTVHMVTVAIPPLDNISNFTNIAIELLGSINSNIKENQTLAALRDSILPKLMSGQLLPSELKEAEAIL